MIVIRVNETGARGDDRCDDRPGIQAAIDRAAAAGGGTVVVPSGMRCRTGTLRLASRVELHLERGSALVASDRPDDYPSAERPVVLAAEGAEDVTVAGRGTIEGHARDFMARNLGYIWEPARFRPGLLQFVGCRRVRLEGVTFHDSAFWTVHLVGCEQVDVLDLVVDNDLAVPNCDGVVPDRCRDVRIHGCRIRCADDAIVLKTSGERPDLGPVEDVRVSDCELMCTASAIKLGSGTAGDFRNLSFSDCVVRSSCRGLVIQLRDQGSVENAVFRGFQIETRLFDPHYWGHAEPIQVTAVRRTERQADGRRAAWNPDARLGTVRGVKFSDIEARCEGGVVLYGSPGSELRDVEISSLRLRIEKWSRWPGGYLDLRPIDLGGSDVWVEPGRDPGRIPRKVPGILARCVQGLRLRDVTVERGTGPLDYLGEALELDRAESVSIDGFSARGFASPPRQVLDDGCVVI
jgi:hypothetical protein